MRARDAFRLLVESNRVGSSGWIINPIVYTNQVQEDLFGRPSRLSRRVNIKRTALECNPSNFDCVPNMPIGLGF